MKLQYLIILLFVIVAIILACSKTKNESQPNSDLKKTSPKSEIPNNKFVVIEGATETEVKKIVQDFCATYNQENHNVVLRLRKLSDRKSVVTFPYDCRFDIFCYFINYASYPIGFDKKFTATGWTNTKPNDVWITELSANKNVMVFISENDNEYDNVFLTTMDNVGYKLGFAIGEQKQLLKTPEKRYSSLEMDFKTVDSREYTDFK